MSAPSEHTSTVGRPMFNVPMRNVSFTCCVVLNIAGEKKISIALNWRKETVSTSCDHRQQQYDGYEDRRLRGAYQGGYCRLLWNQILIDVTSLTALQLQYTACSVLQCDNVVGKGWIKDDDDINTMSVLMDDGGHICLYVYPKPWAKSLYASWL